MQCTLLTPRVRQWIAYGRPARILHLFDAACNLVNDQGQVISLVSPCIGAGPFTAMLEEQFTAGLDANSPVTVDPVTRSLTVGEATVETGQAALWNPVPAWNILRNNKGLLAEKGWLHLSPEIEGPLQQLLAGIANGRAEDIRNSTHRLGGLGRGLTPAGDDVLMGVIYGLWVWQPDREQIRLIVETAVPRTTTLSASFLRAAGDGEATVHWHNLVNGRHDAINQILAIGQSSGRDAWNGFARLGQLLAARR